jgi:hypothetical protein
MRSGYNSRAIEGEDLKFTVSMRLREIFYILIVLGLLLVLTHSVLASLGLLSVLGLFVALWGGLPPSK